MVRDRDEPLAINFFDPWSDRLDRMSECILEDRFEALVLRKPFKSTARGEYEARASAPISLQDFFC
jgi:hypothetical protein